MPTPEPRLRLALIPLLMLVGAGCASSRWYQLPLTPAEAPLVFPALAATAQGMGLEMRQWPDRVNVTLEDGTGLAWVANADDFKLWVQLDEKAVPPAQLDGRYREVKVKADQIWQLAIEARQKNNVGAAVVLTPSPAPQPPASRPPQRTFPGAAAPAPAAAFSCRSGLDCGPGQFCKERSDGVRVCMGNGGPGAACQSGIDCQGGLFCRERDGFKGCSN